ncbi:MAG TPA: MBL fold metallo-hydrolase [Gemmataceae bacterium]|nr:MBL fold metallo-hydrolase [Gemmataceae bacterium]
MSGLRLLALGVGDAFSALYYSTCLALEAGGSWLLVDCPHPIRKILREAGLSAGAALDVAQIDALVLTHLHADHSSGIEGFAFFARFLQGRRLPLLAHPDVLARLWDGHLAGSMEAAIVEPGGAPVRRCLDDFFEVRPLSEERPVEVGPFSVQCRHALHSIPTTALRVRAAGRCLGYSADTAFDPTLIDWLAGADLIVHETNPGLMHTPYENLARLPAALRAKMRLIHYPDTFDLAASTIEPMRQGQSYDI